MLSDNHRIQARPGPSSDSMAGQMPMTQRRMPGTPGAVQRPMQNMPQAQTPGTAPMQTQMPETPGAAQRPMQNMPQAQTPGTAQMQTQMPMTQQGPPSIMSREYVPGYMKSLIGKYILAEFVVGTNSFVDRAGQLMEVGSNYFVLRDTNFNTTVMCDLYSVRFVTVLS